VDTDRWRDVPFILRSGKQLKDSKELVSLIMKETHGPFGDLPDGAARLEISLAGAGAIGVALILKRPGPDLTVTEQRIDLGLAEVPDSTPLPPYVALLHDVMTGDRSLFTSSGGLAHAWRVADPVVKNPPEPIPYKTGSWGPKEAAELTNGLGFVTELDAG
jgi:glucose-6-phosphate 1-dehydrogenase